ncbi:MAG: methyltransferase domain-containing protein [Oscillospiraceae bacterium]|nr:methyltransferase domain-containing protein [Oscillospiraceae bacterium]
MNNNARRAALLALMDFRTRPQTGADKPLNRRAAGLPPRDKALAAQLVYGVIQNYRKLDACIDLICEKRKVQPQVRDVLRLGVYQMLFLDKIPKSAAADQSVELGKYLKVNKGAQSFINAVLRNAAKWENAPVFDDPGVEYSHPDWLVKLYTEEFPERAVELMKFNNTAPPAYLQLLKPEYREKLIEAGACRGGLWPSDRSEQITDCRGGHWPPVQWEQFTYKGNIADLPGYKNGAFIVADNAARLAVEIAAPQKGERVLDACAAPGGKSVMLYHASGGGIELVCCDKYPYKVMELKETLAKHGMDGVQCNVVDAREHNPVFDGVFDLVLADVPCSCLGIIRKKPDIRFKEPSFGEPLAEIQRSIINNLSRYVSPGGRMVYVTCTVLSRENQDVVRDFLKVHTDFELEPFETPYGSAPEGFFLTPFAEHDIDGFFYAKLRKIK